jgi:CRP-like cAMP-binding protein
MGQILCKDCCKNSSERRKNAAVVTWGEVTNDTDFFNSPYLNNSSDGSSTTGTGLRSSPSSSNLDPKRSKRIKNKKRNVALHAEFRDRENLMDILAPPLCCERVMEDTDNVFCGQELGIDTLHSTVGALQMLGSSVTVRSDESPLVLDGGKMGSCYFPDTSLSSPVKSSSTAPNSLTQQEGHHEQPLVKHEKTPEENAFLDEALSDEDNIVFEMLPPHLRQKLKDYLERIVVPKNTLLIKKGDAPDYLYLILEGEIAVYIDPDEYIDENAVEIGKHAPIDISLNNRRTSTSSTASNTSAYSSSNNTAKREFKQSYVLNLRKSLFTSFDAGNNTHSPNILGKVFNLARHSFRDSRMSGLSHNASMSALLEDTSTSDDGMMNEEASFTLYNDLKGLKHERDLGPQDVFGELALIYNTTRTASCVTSTNCVLYRIDGDAFRRILSSSNSDRVKKRCTESKAALEALHNVGVVDEMDEKTLKAIGSALTPVVFKEGDLVITKGTYNDLMFFVMAGKLLVHDVGTGDSRKENIELNEGGHFGEYELLFGRPSYANVTVLTPKARLMAISKKDYRRR